MFVYEPLSPLQCKPFVFTKTAHLVCVHEPDVFVQADLICARKTAALKMALELLLCEQ